MRKEVTRRHLLCCPGTCLDDKVTVPNFDDSPEIRLMSRTNFVPDWVPFLFYRFYSVFLIIFFRTETLGTYQWLSRWGEGNSLRLVQSSVKMSVRSKQKHGCGVGINWIAISVLSPSSNGPRKNLHFHRRKEGEVSKISVRIACLQVRVTIERSLSGTYSNLVWYTGVHHFTHVTTRYTVHSTTVGTRKLNNGQRYEWNGTIKNDLSKTTEIPAELVLVAHSGLQRSIEQDTDRHRYSEGSSPGH
jgi:hypothetical protein